MEETIKGIIFEAKGTSIMKYLKLMRVKHWVKNFLIFFPLIFSGNLLNKEICFKVLMGFCVFCFTASAIYILNDLRDIEMDRKNPRKKGRPLASGVVTKKNAVCFLIVLLLIVIIIFCTTNFHGGGGRILELFGMLSYN